MILSEPLRKKGGIIIKNIKFFLMIIICIFLIGKTTIKANAESANFYEGEYINGIYMSKYQYSTKKIYYQKARFFREAGTNKPAYCIEPFSFFNESERYESIINPTYLTQSQIDRIKKIAHFGYGYKNHEEEKWYAITQMMIWKESDPNSGRYYFTNGLNGPEIDIYQEEMNEINNLIKEYETISSALTKDIYIAEDDKISIEINNIENYYSDDENIIINGNKIESKELKEGEYEFRLYKKDIYYNSPSIFYQAANSQDLIKTGDIDNITIKLKIKVIKTKLEITKVDYDTRTTTPQGDAQLDGTTYTLYDKEKNEIDELVIENGTATIENLKFGSYFVEEKTPGEGYKKDNTTCAFTLDKNNHEAAFTLRDKVIKGDLVIEKKYGEEDNLENEKNINFEIYNSKNELIETITTNEEGIARITLPYGKYKVKQINTTEGYKINEPFEVTIDDENEKIFKLNDLKIKEENIIEVKVPNTHTSIYKIIITKILLILLIQIL